MMLYFILVVIVALIIFHGHVKRETYNPPPGPKGHPILGNLQQLEFGALYVQTSKLAKTYGPIISLRLGMKRVVVVQSAAAAKEVLITRDLNFCSRSPRVATLKLSYKGLEIAFGPYNECFRQLKRLTLLNLLSNNKLKSSGPIRQDEILRLISNISSLSSCSQIVNLSEMCMNFSCSIMCRLAFGKRYSDDEGRSRFHSLLNEAQARLTAFYFSDYFPLTGWLDKLSGISGRLDTTFQKLDAFYEEIINDHLHPIKPTSSQDDLIHILLHLRQQNTLPFQLTFHHIKALIMNIFIGGSDTTAIMLVWAMTELMKNPGAMKRLQEELRNGTQINGYIFEDDLSKFEYLMGVVKETLRMHPAAPLLIARDTNQKCSIQGYDILPRTEVLVNVWAIARDPKYWKDPEEFMPERFIGNPLDFKGHDYDYLPFGSGRRMCPGMHLGVANMTLTLANLVYHFNWEMPVGLSRQDIDTHVAPGIAMHKKNALYVVANKFCSDVS